jgi:hypothetical protein
VICDLFHTNRFLTSKHQNTYLNPETIHDAPFVQILQADAGKQWVTIKNHNPFYEGGNGGLGYWFIYMIA